MQTIQLTSGSAVPVLGYGTWQLTGEQCLAGVGHALSIGYRHIDTAQMYGNEAEVGIAIKSSEVARSDIFLTTKISRDNLIAGNIIPSAEHSLKSLQTDYLDLLLIHWPVAPESFRQTLADFATLQASGKVRNIGISNFTVAQMTEVVETIGAPVVTNQVEYHALLSQQPVLDYCRAHNMFLTAYSPLGRGEVLKDPTIQSIAQKHGKTPAQVALRWLTQQPGVVAIPKAATPANAQANFESTQFDLTDDDMAAINALPKDQRYINPSFAPQWDNAA